MVLCHLISLRLQSLTIVDQLILVVREVDACPVSEVLANLVLPLQGCFPSPAVHLTIVGVRHLETDDGRHIVVDHHDVGTVLVVVIEGTAELILQEIDVETIVLLVGVLPGDVGIVASHLVGSLPYGGIVDTENISVSIAGRNTAVVDGERIGGVHKAVAVQIGITYQTVAGTELQEAYCLGKRLEEWLIAHYPTHRHRWEGTVTLARSKVLGTIVTHIELCHVAVVPVVGNTTYQTYLAVRHIGIGAWIIAAVLIVEQDGTHIVQTERTVVVKTCLEIPVTAATGTLRILQLLLVTIFLIFIGTVVLEYRGIGSLLGVCLLIDGVCTVVGSLHLERETLGNHIELLLQLEVELQLVVGSLHETAIHIIIAEIGNTAATHERKLVGTAILILGLGSDVSAVDDTRTGEWSSLISLIDQAG